MPTHCHRVLDVGCGAGAFGESPKQTRKIVINSRFDLETELPAGTFDSAVFSDVLEHMVAPEQELRYAKALLSQGTSGCFVNWCFMLDGSMKIRASTYGTPPSASERLRRGINSRNLQLPPK